MPELTADSYMLAIHHANIRYRKIHVGRNALPWHRGVLHEFLTCEDARPAGHLPIAMRMDPGAGPRDPERYRKEAAIA